MYFYCFYDLHSKSLILCGEALSYSSINFVVIISLKLFLLDEIYLLVKPEKLLFFSDVPNSFFCILVIFLLEASSFELLLKSWDCNWNISRGLQPLLAITGVSSRSVPASLLFFRKLIDSVLSALNLVT